MCFPFYQSTTNVLTPWSRFFPEKLTVVYLVKKLHRFLWNPEFHYHVHKAPPLIPILSQMNAEQTSPTCFPKTRSQYLSIYACLLPGLFPSGFPIKIFYAFLIYLCVLQAPPISSSVI
jgi:hypothetical protein